MKKLISLTSIIFLFLFLNTAFNQTVDEVIDNHAKAMGGADNLLSIKSVKYTAKFLGNGAEIPAVVIAKREGKARLDMTYQGMDMTRASDGTLGWFINPFQGKKEAEKMPLEEFKDMKKMAEIEGELVNYKSKGYKLELLGKDDFEGSEVYKIKLIDKDGDVTYYLLDVSTYLILKETKKTKIGEKEIKVETIYGNYQKIDGVMFPMSIEILDAGGNQGQKATIEKVELNVDINDDIFKMPDAKQ